MFRSRFSALSGFALCLIALAAPLSAQAQVTFTGDADADFSSATAIRLDDVTGIDVGVPLQAPPATVSGHDIDGIVLDFDPNTDTLYIGFDTFGISGDVDGDGADGSTSAWLAGNGGTDLANFAGGEVAAIILDIDEDGIYDVVAGINDTSDFSGIRVANWLGGAPETVMGLSFFWLGSLPNVGPSFYSPTPGTPHLEFAITNFSSLPISSGIDTSLSFGIAAHMGSSADDGIGEDFTPNAVGSVVPPTPVCFDLDQDGSTTCDPDCNDLDPDSYPGAPELCDGIDNDCDGLVPATEIDDDGDGVTECDGDCDDADADNYPGNTEVCDGSDNDCDGAIDEGFDVDGDGVTSCAGDCDDNDPNNHPGNTEVCDGSDNDCNGLVDENGVDADGDGFACDDCDDNDPNNHPGNTEVCDGSDNDCNGLVDENGVDADGDGFACDDCDDADPNNYPGNTEVCDGQDNDCDGVIPADELDADGDGVSECDGDCDDADATVFPGADEVCDGIDNDCNGLIDDGLAVSFDLGVVGDFNVFVFGDLIDIPDIGGSAAAGGDVDTDSFAVNYQAPGGTALVAGDDLQLTNGTIYGDAYYGNAASLTSVTLLAGGALYNASPIDFAAAELELKDTSTSLASLPANGTTTVHPWLAIDLDGTSAGTNVFDLDSADLAVAVSVSISVPASSTVLINVDGFAVSMSSFGFFLSGVDATQILWNMPDALTVDLSAIGVQGSMLAPCADITFNNGSFDGQIIGQSLTGSGEPHHFPFSGDLDADGCSDEVCDGIDNDGDGDIDEGFDLDNDGWTTCDGDCDDDDDTVNPGAEEICDGLDNDCNGFIDDGLLEDLDGDGIPDCIDACPMVIDFDTDAYGNIIPPGAEVSDAYAGWGVTIEQWSDPNMAFLEDIFAYDSANPGPGEEDLGTPNEDFGGPGIGAGGESGAPGQNDDELFNVVRVDDDNTWALVSFTNSTCVHSIDIIDAEPGELEPQIILFDMNLMTIDTVTSGALGDNSVETVDLSGVCGVFAIMIDFYADGAWDNLVVCIDPAGTEEVCGDGIDNDGDGATDEDCPPGEPGGNGNDGPTGANGEGDEADGGGLDLECSTAGGGSASLLGLALGLIGVTARRRRLV